MKDKAAVVVSGVRQVHIGGNGIYATLCGLDGDDPTCEQAMATVQDDEKIDCSVCLDIWQVCRGYTRRDFVKRRRPS